MKIIKGNLIELALHGEFDLIIHGCNCQHTMGAGIAKSIKQHFPSAYLADLETKKGDRKKLGTLKSTTITIKNKFDIVVVNAYTQYDFGGKKRNVDYRAIRQCFSEVKRQFGRLKIGYPMIGSGLAGGDWSVISEIINEELEGCDHTVIQYVK